LRIEEGLKPIGRASKLERKDEVSFDLLSNSIRGFGGSASTQKRAKIALHA